jgi:hypothetical protein
MKKETLKEAAELYVWGGVYLTEQEKQQTEIAFYEGANWQAERMYSEEDMEEAFTNGLNRSFDSDFDRWLGQFKKK